MFSSDFNASCLSSNRLVESPKEFGRFCLKTRNGENLLLSVAVDGGGRQLRNYRSVSSVQLSEHGNWRKTHIKAIEAVLGNTPFYRHFKDPLEGVFLNESIKDLSEFNMAIFKVLFAFLMQNIDLANLNKTWNNQVCIERGKEIICKLSPEMSILQCLAIYGPETLLAILAWNREALDID